MATPIETLERRRADWVRLDQMLSTAPSASLRGFRGEALLEISRLYRDACADLALAEQYQLTPETVQYLHELIGRAHNKIYPAQRFQYHTWWNTLFHIAPRQIYQDNCVRFCALLFFGLFSASAYMGYYESFFPDFAEQILGEQTQMMSESFSEINFRSDRSRDISINLTMVAFYIQHNTGIGLECFALGPLIIPGILKTAYNATFLGAAFGYMARPGTPGGESFMEFVVAHGPFELTAIALAAAAGLRIGLGWLITGGLTRLASMQKSAQKAMPVIAASCVLFFLAAFTEGLISPTNLPYAFKAAWGIMASTLLMLYFVVLGYPDRTVSQDR
ncbi:MAG TPA: stage II sporulation protein M [Planctomycetaceae bacterium]|nr:stage II sporulation protein M [Planctomycetaceae bacterium]